MVFHWLWDLVVRISANSAEYFIMRVTEWGLFIDCIRTAVAQWLRCRATNRKVAGSIPDGVIGIFH